ncbi:hypothetical protein FE257_003813 [Aspergillus nanangensis]|uniref:Uncharacterized protein n=1 Tax=Aspergillus nanangensis TaxID=2582783 RepID=A0AAD4GNB2_ASPNN|nr:hypothetical protein FE257_003813 [Aspergillus nanangensis]
MQIKKAISALIPPHIHTSLANANVKVDQCDTANRAWNTIKNKADQKEKLLGYLKEDQLNRLLQDSQGATYLRNLAALGKAASNNWEIMTNAINRRCYARIAGAETNKKKGVSRTVRLVTNDIPKAKKLLQGCKTVAQKRKAANVLTEEELEYVNAVYDEFGLLIPKSTKRFKSKGNKPSEVGDFEVDLTQVNENDEQNLGAKPTKANKKARARRTAYKRATEGDEAEEQEGDSDNETEDVSEMPPHFEWGHRLQAEHLYKLDGAKNPVEGDVML